jgi:Domain of unknown function (DUF4157)
MTYQHVARRLTKAVATKRQDAGPAPSPASLPRFSVGNLPVYPLGLPDPLRSGIEALSGVSMDGVRVHYNSPHPASIGALAYARGREIHLGRGQEEHLPHEAWHLVQQAQRRVEPTMEIMDQTPINADTDLEREADVMGVRALSLFPAAVAATVSSVPSGQRLAAMAGHPVQFQRGRARRKEFKNERARAATLKREVPELPLGNPEDPALSRVAEVPRRSQMRQEQRHELDPWDIEAWSNSVAATRHLLPSDHPPMVRAKPGHGISANTSVTGGRIRVDYDPEDDELAPRRTRVTHGSDEDEDDDAPDFLSNREVDQRTGTLTQTFTHELAAHGNTLGADPEDEHASMHDPKKRGTYLGATAGVQSAKELRAEASLCESLAL